MDNTILASWITSVITNAHAILKSKTPTGRDNETEGDYKNWSFSGYPNAPEHPDKAEFFIYSPGSFGTTAEEWKKLAHVVIIQVYWWPSEDSRIVVSNYKGGGRARKKGKTIKIYFKDGCVTEVSLSYSWQARYKGGAGGGGTDGQSVENESLDELDFIFLQKTIPEFLQPNGGLSTR